MKTVPCYACNGLGYRDDGWDNWSCRTCNRRGFLYEEEKDDRCACGGLIVSRLWTNVRACSKCGVLAY